MFQWHPALAMPLDHGSSVILPRKARGGGRARAGGQRRARAGGRSGAGASGGGRGWVGQGRGEREAVSDAPRGVGGFQSGSSSRRAASRKPSAYESAGKSPR
ncbi:hypothetical protein GA0070623_1804 [Micromonospora rifamycinica]|uniref:Uncharacterized protein n=1 Tax=Micromonospora rifamycinica TaxID=291594 RepID=A0A1C5HWH8_9ACTN|nr:hypothetical protein GA0070623_1804 [Micromonospora rifamycinica]